MPLLTRSTIAMMLIVLAISFFFIFLSSRKLGVNIEKFISAKIAIDMPNIMFKKIGSRKISKSNRLTTRWKICRMTDSFLSLQYNWVSEIIYNNANYFILFLLFINAVRYSLVRIFFYAIRFFFFQHWIHVNDALIYIITFTYAIFDKIQLLWRRFVKNFYTATKIDTFYTFCLKKERIYIYINLF